MTRCHELGNLINSFSINAPFLFFLKISENLQFSDVFRGYRNGTLVENGLMIQINLFTPYVLPDQVLQLNDKI